MITRFIAWLIRLGRKIHRFGWLIAGALIVLTVYIGTFGFRHEPENKYTYLDSMYKATGLLALQLDINPSPGNWQLELARWLGVIFFAGALITFAIRLFREAVLRLLIKCVRRHTIVTSLGENGIKLVTELCSRRQTVVVIESDREHPAIDQARQAGAIVLFGATDSPEMLIAAGLRRAEVLLTLFQSEQESVRTATTAFEILRKEQKTARKKAVRCVLRLIEPGLLDVIRRHKIKTMPDDRFHLEILNSHEIAATTMVREAVAHSRDAKLTNLLVLGLGTHHRLGELVILRALKDHLIHWKGEVPDDRRLAIDVYDKEATEWYKNFLSKYEFVDKIATVTPHDECWARKVGCDMFKMKEYDAAFVCIGDDGPATGQAVMLRDHVLTRNQPIMVRVQHSQSGYGQLLNEPNSGWGDQIHAVGLDDALFDPNLALQPELELRAMTIHQQYREKLRRDEVTETDPVKLEQIRIKSNNKPWIHLDESDRTQNRGQAISYDNYLDQISYEKRFDPRFFCTMNPSMIVQLTEAELEKLEREEHERFVTLRKSEGWTYGEVRDKDKLQSPFITAFENLTPEQRAYNRELVLNMTAVLALADYTIVRRPG